jgi:hypothetical protein
METLCGQSLAHNAFDEKRQRDGDLSATVQTPWVSGGADRQTDCRNENPRGLHITNAKTQRRHDAKKNLLYPFASLRLGVFAFSFLPTQMKYTPSRWDLSQILGNKCRTHQTPGRQALPSAQPALTLHRGMGDYRGET